jgi:hypothetical protein
VKAVQNHHNAIDLHERRALISSHASIHGIDYLTVVDAHTLHVYFIAPERSQAGKKPLPVIAADDIHVEMTINGTGRVVHCRVAYDKSRYCLVLTPEITLNSNEEITINLSVNAPYVDPFFASVHYTGYANPALEKKVEPTAVSEPLPQLDYLSKDYESFRQLLQRELARHTPGWYEDNPADMMIAITEVLAYAGDMLSYSQDVVATEAYLDTARFDLSLQRHARLLDYRITPETNARNWICVTVNSELAIPQGTPFFCGDAVDMPVLREDEYRARKGGKEVVFEALHALDCLPDYNAIEPYTFGAPMFTIKKAGTQVAVKGHLHLRVGRAIAFISTNHSQENQVIRLTEDAAWYTDVLSGQAYSILSWSDNDQLLQDWRAQHCALNANILLTDRGETIAHEQLELYHNDNVYAAHLPSIEIITAEPYDHEAACRNSARDALRQNPLNAVAAVKLTEKMDASGGYGQSWQLVHDLLESTAFSNHFVVERDQNIMRVRFGDGTYGQAPNPHHLFDATFRVSPPHNEEVTQGAINQIYMAEHNDRATEAVAKISNIGTAMRSSESESHAITKMAAPLAYQDRRTMALPQDFVARLKEEAEVSDVCYIKEFSGYQPVLCFYIYLKEHDAGHWQLWHRNMQRQLMHSQVMNQDVVLKPHRALLLHIVVEVTPLPDVAVNQLSRQLYQVLSDDDTLGVLAPGHFGFGTALHHSKVIAALSNVEGVSYVVLHSFKRFDDFIGQGKQEQVEEVITPKATEVISYKDRYRVSDITININEVHHG